LAEPPAELYLTGHLPAAPGVAIVGTRHPSQEAEAFAAELAADLARAGLCVLSGGAKGIDAAAHRGALESGGLTLVVAPSGWHRPYPPEHAELFDRVVRGGGGHLSLCPPDVAASQARFFPRNACLVALSYGVVVVEAGFRSGARNAAKHARTLGRKLFVVPSAPWISSGRGCIAELRAGASLLESAKDVLGYLAQINVHALGQQLGLPLPRPTPPAAGASGVLSALKAGACTADAICEATGLAAGEVQQELFALRLRGVVVQEPCGALILIGA
jgi:DNA processing protein